MDAESSGMPKGSRRIDGFVVQARRQEQPDPPTQAPTWAAVALGALLLVGLAVVVASGQPALYAFVAAMVGAGVLERVLDGCAPSWGEGHVVADIESDGVTFRTYRGAVALAVLFFVALAAASILFVVVWTTPDLDLPMFFGAFALVLAAGLVHAVRLVVRSVRRVNIRLNADGVTAVRVLGASETVSWSSLLVAFPGGTSDRPHDVGERRAVADGPPARRPRRRRNHHRSVHGARPTRSPVDRRRHRGDVRRARRSMTGRDGYE